METRIFLKYLVNDCGWVDSGGVIPPLPVGFPLITLNNSETVKTVTLVFYSIQ